MHLTLSLSLSLLCLCSFLLFLLPFVCVHLSLPFAGLSLSTNRRPSPIAIHQETNGAKPNGVRTHTHTTWSRTHARSARRDALLCVNNVDLVSSFRPCLNSHGWSVWRTPSSSSSHTTNPNIVPTSTRSFVTPESFADVQPNPMFQHRQSSSLVAPTWGWLITTSAVTITTVGIVWRLYHRWRKDPTHHSFDKRNRLRHKFDSMPSDVGETPSRLWRFFFGWNNGGGSNRPSNNNNEERTPNYGVMKSSRRNKRSSTSPKSAGGKHRSATPTNAMSSTESEENDVTPNTTNTTNTNPATPAGALPVFGSSSQLSSSHLGQSARFRNFFHKVQLRAAEESHETITQPNEFWRKIEIIRDANRRRRLETNGQDQTDMHILCGFDKTLTRMMQVGGDGHHTHTHTPTLTSQSILNHHLPSSYDHAFALLFQQYYPQEVSPHISHEDKDKYMREWFRRSQSLLTLDEHKLTRNKLKYIVRTSLERGLISLRPGVTELLSEEGSVGGVGGGVCSKNHLPVVIISGTTHDVIEEILEQNHIKVNNANLIDATLTTHDERVRHEASHVMIVSNRMLWTNPSLSTHTPKPLRAVVASSPNGLLTMPPLENTAFSPATLSASSSSSSIASSSSSSTTGTTTFSSALRPGVLQHKLSSRPHSPSASYGGIDAMGSSSMTNLLPLTPPTLPPPVVAPALSISHGSSSCFGFSQRHLVHSLNKSLYLLPDHGEVLTSVARKRHVILIGSTLADANLNEGCVDVKGWWIREEIKKRQQQHHHQHMQQQQQFQHHHPHPHAYHPYSSSHVPDSSLLNDDSLVSLSTSGSEVLRIGFLPVSLTSDRLAAFRAAYDVVLPHDADFTFVLQLIRYLTGEADEPIR